MGMWQLQKAKAQLSEVVRRASEEGPQSITVHGRPVAVLISEAEYRRLAGDKPNFVDFLLSGPPWPDDLVDAINDRSKDPGREIEL